MPSRDEAPRKLPDEDWTHWFDRDVWDVLRDVIPLLLGHDPRRGGDENSFRFTMVYADPGWRRVHLNVAEQGTADLVLAAFHSGHMRGNPRPYDVILWAVPKASIRLPPGFVAEAIRRGWVRVQQPPSPTADVSAIEAILDRHLDALAVGDHETMNAAATAVVADVQQATGRVWQHRTACRRLAQRRREKTQR